MDLLRRRHSGGRTFAYNLLTTLRRTVDVGALARASQAIKLVQELRGIDKALDAAEYKLTIADLTSSLSDIKLALTDAKEELASKDAEVEKLKKRFQRLADTVEFAGLKYDKGPDGKPRGWPYCDEIRSAADIQRKPLCC